MVKNSDLYFEEQREQLKQTHAVLVEVRNAITKQLEVYKAPEKDVVVTGAVTVNTEKEIEVTNIQKVVDALITLEKNIANAIRENAVTPVDTVTVKNLSDIKLDTVRVANIDDIKGYFETLSDTIKNTQPQITVQKQDVTFPTSPTKPVPVRLSDGKSFYNAVFNAVASAGGGDGDPLSGYQITEKDDTGATKYYGYAKPNGAWYILRETSAGSYRYARGQRTESSGSIFSDAWADRANLTYGYIYEVW